MTKMMYGSGFDAGNGLCASGKWEPCKLLASAALAADAYTLQGTGLEGARAGGSQGLGCLGLR